MVPQSVIIGGNMNTYYPVVIQIPQIKESTAHRIQTPADILNICFDICQASQECLQTLAVNSKNKLISRRLITLGLLDSSLAHPREVFRGAIEDSANSIIIIHNHPSGDTTPSAEDIRITRQLIDAGRIIGIPVLDHCILGYEANNRKIMSMRDSGLLSF